MSGNCVHDIETDRLVNAESPESGPLGPKQSSSRGLRCGADLQLPSLWKALKDSPWMVFYKLLSRIFKVKKVLEAL